MGLVKETEAFTTGQNHWLGADYSFVQFYFLQYYFVYTQNILVKETLKRETLKKLWTLAVRAVLFTSFRQRGRRSFSELKAQYKKNHEIIITSSPEGISGEVTETQRKPNW